MIDKKYIIISLTIILASIIIAGAIIFMSGGNNITKAFEEKKNFTISDITPYAIDGLLSQDVVCAETSEWLKNISSQDDYRVYETLNGDYLVVGSKDQSGMPEINPYVGSTDSEGNWHDSIVSCHVMETHKGSDDGYGTVYLVDDCSVVGEKVS